MRIQHNIMAMSAYRNYTNNVSAMKKNLEKLSSGYKINRAGDDAAGLAISEKMRAQITGLETAQKNAKDGISLVQTAEGALTEVHDMLNRMVELATQSANGTYDNTTDRWQMQKEVNQLREEINRIADSSNFNGINLLDGSLQDGTQVGIETKKYDIDTILGMIPAEGEKSEAGVVGDKTVTESDSVTAATATFDISLDGLSTITTTAANSTFTLKIGTDELTVTLATAGDYSAASIADLFRTTFTSAAAVTIGSGTFEVKGSGTNLHFESTQAGKVNLTPGAKVTWSWSPDGTATEYSDDGIASLDDGFVVYAAGDPTINPVGASVTVSVGSNSATVDLKGGIGWAGGAAAALASGAGVTAGEIKLSYNSTSGWVVTVGTTAALTAAAASATVPGSAASGSALEIDFGDGVKLTLTATGITSSETLADTDYQAAFGTAQKIGTLGVESGGGAGSGGGVSGGGTSGSTTGSATITLPQVGSVTGDYSSATSATTIQTGDAAVLTTYFKTGAGSSISVDGKTVKLDSVALADGDSFEKLAKQIGAAVKAELDKDSQYTYSNIKVQIGNDTPIAIQAQGDMPQIKVTFTKTQKGGGGGDTPVAAGAHGVINRGMQNTNSGADAANKILANTRVDFTNGGKIDAWKDGTELKIGSYKVTLYDGDDSTYKPASGGIDISKLKDANGNVDVQKVVEAVANDANAKCAEFSVGHDGNYITIQQKEGKLTGKLTTREDIAKQLGIETKGLKAGYTEAVAGHKLMLQIGDTADKFNQLEVEINDCHTYAMVDKDSGLSIADISIADQKSAASAVDVIKSAINYVSDVRGTLGATQNRLDHTINNLSVMTENIQDAESTIRDVDVAEEMMAYTKNNILIQSAQAMLAQANQVPQGVLQLLG